MTDPERSEFEPTTFWHPLLVALLEHYLPEGWQLVPELQLTRLPQRIDIVIVRRTGEPAGVPRKLHTILDYLLPHTLIEHKGPNDDLAAEDALVLLGYAAQYMRLNKLKDPREICLMVVCDHILPGFVEQVEKLEGSFTVRDAGVWQGSLAGFTMHGVETRDACRLQRSERLLYAFSRAHLTAPLGILPLDGEDVSVYTGLHRHIEQLRREYGPMAIRALVDADDSFEMVIEAIAKALPTISKERRDRVIREFSPEERLAGLTPEERLAGLTPKELEQLEQLAKKLQH